MKMINKTRILKSILIFLLLLVSTSSTLALPPDPDNAALLYYQALLLIKQPDETMKEMIADLAKGRIAVHDKITQYVESNRRVIDLTSEAAEMPFCDWGLKFSDGLSLEMPYLSQAKILTWLILADARIHASRQEYEAVFDQCLTASKFGLHIAEEPTLISYLMGVAIERRANECIRDFLGSAQIKAEKLKLLRRQLDELDNKQLPLEFYYETERQVMTMYMTTERIHDALAFLDPGDKARELLANADEQFCQRNRDYYNELMAATLSAFDLPYQQAYEKLMILDKKAAEEFKENSDATMTTIFTPATWKIYNHQIVAKTLSNAIKTAIEIYLIKLDTNTLPDTLGSGLPKDMFSGEDFEYEKTADGFVLRCRSKDLDKDKIHEYGFKVAK